MFIQRLIRWLIYLLLVGGAASGGYAIARWPRPVYDSRLDIPSEVRAQPGRLTVIQCASAAKVCWHVCQTTFMPDVLPLDDGKTLVFVAAAAGKYELWAWSAANGTPTEAARCVVYVEGPAPIDPLIEALRTAWAKESSANKSRYRDALANVYRVGADDLVRQATTVGELYAAIRRSAQAVLPDDALSHVRTAIGEALRQRLPTTDGPMTEDIRKRCAVAFRAVAEALRKLEVNNVNRATECATCR